MSKRPAPDMGKLPWMKFDTQHWRADPCLRRCSAAARGVWADMLTLMHEAEPYGYLASANGFMTLEELASVVGMRPSKLRPILDQLRTKGVYSVDASRPDCGPTAANLRTSSGQPADPNGAIYCRKMVRDHKRNEANTENGKLGGNPTLTGKVSTKKEGKILYYPRRFVDTSSVNPPVNPWVKAEEKREEKEKESAPQGSPLGGAPLGAGMVAQALRRQPHIQEPLRSPAEQLAALGFTPDGKKMR